MPNDTTAALFAFGRFTVPVSQEQSVELLGTFSSLPRIPPIIGSYHCRVCFDLPLKAPWSFARSIPPSCGSPSQASHCRASVRDFRSDNGSASGATAMGARAGPLANPAFRELEIAAITRPRI